MTDDNILQFPKREKEAEKDSSFDATILSPELIRDYRECILLVAEHSDALSREDYVNAYAMMLRFNHLLLCELGGKFVKI